ncbi:hypothetical protein PoB_001393600 [Plakobranchus ocellatus]|uniref:Uncharacterized protein n=1 Tax=Plakobranchus ocellatus TaxID=259542 RepID=A0AAV3YYJ8_9GAST|nr:hypothetical protein PoB_001393600 [Plakobranchus ocellatus]
MTSRLGSVGQRCPTVSGEGNGQGGMLVSDSPYCRAVTISSSRIHPSPHTGRTSGKQGAHTVGSPLTTSTVLWVHSIPDSTWEEKEVEDGRRRSGRDESAGKEVGIEDKSQVEKEMSPCPEREAVHRRQPALIASYDPRQPRWSTFFPPGPTRGVNELWCVYLGNGYRQHSKEKRQGLSFLYYFSTVHVKINVIVIAKFTNAMHSKKY